MLTLEEKKERLRAYYTAEQKILKGQAWSDKDKSVQHTNLIAVQRQISLLEKEIAREEGIAPSTLRRILIRDA